MITKESTDKEILDHPLGNSTIRDYGSISFLAWMADKLNGAPTFRAETQELLGLVKGGAPLGRMPEEEKIRIVRKLLLLDIKI